MLKSTLNKVNLNGSLCYITFKNFNKHKEIRHLFSTRLGGVSKGCFSEMNLSFKVGDDVSCVMENYKILCGAAGINSENLVLSQQTHTNNVKIVDKSDIGKGIFRQSDFTDVDGLITNTPGVALVTHSADCCLIAFYDPEKRVIAASHAGWRGTTGEIGRITVEKMRAHFGCKPENIIAAIAPSICKKCYEVDTPVYNRFAEIKYLDLSTIFSDKGNGKYQLDLWEANKQILINAGVEPQNIEVTDICTNCNSRYLHSHRATGGKRGVNGLILEIKE